ncbi:hypothetical protein [Sediminicoccus sp. KRV36]|uniref:hypothetical protein n=1 Tax=Sediminicoccus sp. KRV36 TaxID=3133721 RepID=UPI00200E1647|nr:hypothetical protein [Sediminicoccus rosea]UPY35429.1 hypothetical protein LHU95_14515 [Sediminicoccus rosea]
MAHHFVKSGAPDGRHHLPVPRGRAVPVPAPRHGAKLDFSSIARAAIPHLPSLLPDWLPGGRREGHEWTCGSLSGEAGASCKVNLTTGRWCDFATGQKGGDAISLLAAIRDIRQGSAARELAARIGMGGRAHG